MGIAPGAEEVSGVSVDAGIGVTVGVTVGVAVGTGVLVGGTTAWGYGFSVNECRDNVYALLPQSARPRSSVIRMYMIRSVPLFHHQTSALFPK